jgi:hypothetical protein
MSEIKLFSDEDKTILFEGMEVSDESQSDFLIKLESVIAEKVGEKEEEIIEKHEVLFESAKEDIQSELEENINSYLDYVVENWMEENEIAIESGMKLEIMENFMTGMKDLFVESYVEIPEEKADVVSEAQNRIDSLESDLATQIDATVALKEEIESLQKEKIVSEYSDGLTETQKEKLVNLVEGVDFGNSEIFDRKVKTIRESYFKDGVTEPTNDVDASDEIDESNPMAKYLAHL